jgi:hypothetical protein
VTSRAEWDFKLELVSDLDPRHVDVNVICFGTRLDPHPVTVLRADRNLMMIAIVDHLEMSRIEHGQVAEIVVREDCLGAGQSSLGTRKFSIAQSHSAIQFSLMQGNQTFHLISLCSQGVLSERRPRMAGQDPQSKQGMLGRTRYPAEARFSILGNVVKSRKSAALILAAESDRNRRKSNPVKGFIRVHIAPSAL